MFFDLKKDYFEWSAYTEEDEEEDDDNVGGRDSGLSSHPSVVVFVVGGPQGSGSTRSAAKYLFDP